MSTRDDDPSARASAMAAAGASSARIPGRVVVLVLLAGALVGALTPPRAFSDASNYVGMVESLVFDRDLRWTRADLDRVRALHLGEAPAGLLLVKRPDGYAFAKPVLYPLLATPFVAVAGARGFMLLNGLLLAALLLLGADVLAHRLAWPAALGVAALAIGVSVTPAYLHWIDPFLLFSVLVAGAVAACRRERLVLAGAVLGVLAAIRFPYAALLLAPGSIALLRRRWRDLGSLAIGALAAAAALLLLTRALLGQWSPYTGERYYYADVVPYETAADGEVGLPYSREDLLGGWRPPPLADAVSSAGELLVGRFAGLLLYTPALFACLFWARRLDREKSAWLLAVAASCAITLVVIPHRRLGGSYALGNRQFVLLPVALVLVDFVAWNWGRLLATLLVMGLAVPIAEAPVHFSLHPGHQTLHAPYKWFPVEWQSAIELPFPIEMPGMAALTGEQYWQEEGGAWTRGSARAQFVLIRRVGTPASVELWSLLPSARIGDGDAIREVTFQPFVRQTIVLSHPMATIADEYDGFAESAVYLLTIETDSGVRPSDIGLSADRRWLGVFVRAVQ